MRQKHNKVEIIERGIRIFREKGYHNTGVDDILDACKIPSGSFYNFFKNKEGFAIQALEQYNQQYIQYLHQHLSDSSISAMVRLKNAFRGSIDDHIDNECSLGCLLNSMTSEVGITSLKIGEKIIEDYSNNSKIIAQTIKEGQDAGEIRTDYSAQDLANYLINGMVGATTRMKAGKTEEPLHLFIRTAFDFIKK